VAGAVRVEPHGDGNQRVFITVPDGNPSIPHGAYFVPSCMPSKVSRALLGRLARRKREAHVVWVHPSALTGHLVSLGYHDLERVRRADQGHAMVPLLTRKALEKLGRLDLWPADWPPAPAPGVQPPPLQIQNPQIMQQMGAGEHPPPGVSFGPTPLYFSIGIFNTCLTSIFMSVQAGARESVPCGVAVDFVTVGGCWSCVWQQVDDDDDIDADAAPAADVDGAPLAHAKGPSSIVLDTLRACAMAASKSRIYSHEAGSLNRPLTNCSFQVGTADVPSDHWRPPLPLGAAEPKVAQYCAEFAAACVVVDGPELVGPGPAPAVRLVFVYSQCSEDAPVAVYLQRPVVPLGSSPGASYQWRSNPMFPELLDVARSLLGVGADFETVPIPGDDVVEGVDGVVPRPAHHLLVQLPALKHVAKALLLCFRQKWRPCVGSSFDPSSPTSPASVSGRGQGSLYVWCSAGLGERPPCLFSVLCPFALWSGRGMRCPLCERLNTVMRKRASRSAPHTPPKAVKEGDAGEDTGSEDEGAMEDSDDAGDGSDAKSGSDSDGEGDTDSDSEGEPTPGERLVRDKLETLLLTSQVAEVRGEWTFISQSCKPTRAACGATTV
jgi:hypothetical protein